MGIVIGVVVALLIAAFFAVLTCKSKRPDLLKWIGIVLFLAFIASWIIPGGSLYNGEFIESGLTRIGLSDMPTILYYGIYFAITSIILFFVIGGFYGVVSKTSGYKELVKRFSASIKGKELLTSIIIVALIVVLTSFLRTALVIVFFIPFLLTVLLNAKFDKLTAMGITFGSLLVGTLAATYGTEGLYWFNSYMSTEVSVGLTYRLIIAGAALLLFEGFTVWKVLRMLKTKKINDVEADLYAIESTTTKGKKNSVKVWPIIVIFSFVAVITLLGYVGWSESFGIECFDSFHAWITELSIGDHTVVSYVLGSSSLAFGSWEVSLFIIVILFVTLMAGLMEKVSVADFVDSYYEGLSKMFKPVLFYVLATIIFVTAYMSQFMAYVSDWAYGLTSTINPFIAVITSFVTSIFHADLGYTGYLVGSLITTSNNVDLIHTIYVVTYGLVQLFIPTSGLLLVGLSYLKIDYKSWFKYIWTFVVAMVLVLLILVTLVTFVF